ncbi:MAG: lipocalin family protein [Rikenellaceae bacterium]|nr:lipocalin family protein [Rikenellaceae bacterium]
MNYCKKRKKKKIITIGAIAVTGAILAAAAVAICLKKKRTIPKGVRAVMPFELDKFLGTWYEIARLDYKQEKNMQYVTAEYSINPDGSVKVINKGYDTEKGEWEEVEGKAKFVDDQNEGMLKVSFFGPFYSGYNVIAIDPEYKYALIAGEDMDYLWLLSREKTMPDDVRKEYLRLACHLGYEIHDLLWTQQ